MNATTFLFLMAAGALAWTVYYVVIKKILSLFGVRI